MGAIATCCLCPDLDIPRQFVDTGWARSRCSQVDCLENVRSEGRYLPDSRVDGGRALGSKSSGCRRRSSFKKARLQQQTCVWSGTCRRRRPSPCNARQILTKESRCYSIGDSTLEAARQRCTGLDSSMETWMRAWRDEAVQKHQYQSAIYVGDKLLALTSTQQQLHGILMCTQLIAPLRLQRRRPRTRSHPLRK